MEAARAPVIRVTPKFQQNSMGTFVGRRTFFVIAPFAGFPQLWIMESNHVGDRGGKPWAR
jgi:hypothetical protein